MADILGGLWFSAWKDIESLLSLGASKVETLNASFKLHSHLTFALLLVSSGLLELAKFAGKPIQCRGSGNDELDSIGASFCWTSSTYVIAENDTWAVENVGRGLGKVEDGDKRFWVSYYQWTPWVLLLLAFAFYLPRWIWWQLECGALHSIVKAFINVKLANLPRAELNAIV